MELTFVLLKWRVSSCSRVFSLLSVQVLTVADLGLNLSQNFTISWMWSIDSLKSLDFICCWLSITSWYKVQSVIMRRVTVPWIFTLDSEGKITEGLWLMPKEVGGVQTEPWGDVTFVSFPESPIPALKMVTFPNCSSDMAANPSN